MPRLETLVTRPDASNRLSHVTWVFRISFGAVFRNICASGSRHRVETSVSRLPSLPIVTVTMTDKDSHYTSCSHAVKNTSQSKEETDNTPTEKTEQVTADMKQGLRTLSFSIESFLKKFKQ